MLRRLRKLRQRFGIAAPQVAVRTALPWYLRWAALALFSAFAVAGAAWIYDAGRRFAGFDRGEIEQELFAARAELAKLKAELEGLRASANAAEARLAVERSAQAKLAQQLRTLEHEAARLREELAIFEAMATSAAPAPGTLSILRFRVEPDPMPGEYRYRLLLRAPRRGVPRPGGARGEPHRGRAQCYDHAAAGGKRRERGVPAFVPALPAPGGLVPGEREGEGGKRAGAGLRVGQHERAGDPQRRRRLKEAEEESACSWADGASRRAASTA